MSSTMIQMKGGYIARSVGTSTLSRYYLTKLSGDERCAGDGYRSHNFSCLVPTTHKEILVGGRMGCYGRIVWHSVSGWFLDSSTLSRNICICSFFLGDNAHVHLHKLVCTHKHIVCHRTGCTIHAASLSFVHGPRDSLLPDGGSSNGAKGTGN